jgi:hypothetical protein
MSKTREQRDNYEIFYREFGSALIVFEENLRTWDRQQVDQRVGADGSKNSSS